MSNTPSWVRDLTDADLNRRFGAATAARGRQIASLGRVGDVQVSDGAISAPVRDNGMRVFVASLSEDSTHCTCPDGPGCRHVVALALLLRDAPEEGTSSKWRRTLTKLLPSGDVGQRSGSTPLALQVEQGATGLALRPVQLGARGTWLKAGATWGHVQRATAQFQATHRQALLNLLDARRSAGNGFVPDLLNFDALRPDAWHTLAAAVAVGVQLVPGDDAAGRALPTIVLSGEAAAPTVAVTRTDGGALISPTVVIDGVAHELPAKSLQGNPGHGVALRIDDQLVLAPLTRPLDEAEHAVFTTGPVTVPDRDLQLFASGFLPHMKRRLDVRVADDANVPQPARTTLVCRVDFGENIASIRWAFRYALGDEVHDLLLKPEAHEPPLRDPEAEAQLARQVPPGPWRSDHGDGATLRPSFLSGRSLIEFVTDAL
ncbi:MAG TPA: SWIM zinc finger family protein, partial [Tessaracoccus flavescens]|nr:SWIM zinc finger family protein [Tessaracoccus flavescens]